jgi:hypothetical protein
MKIETKTAAGKSQKYYWPDGGEMSEEEGLAMEKKTFEKSPFGLGNLKKTAGGLAPEYPGGASSLNAFIQTKLRALMTRKENVFGGSSFISVTFHLDKKGRAENIKVEGADSDLQMYLYRAFQTMPAWKMNGLTEYGPVHYNLSISSTGY